MCTFIRSWPRHGGMMAGLDSTFNAAIMIGYHASASSSAGVRAHTIWWRRVVSARRQPLSSGSAQAPMCYPPLRFNYCKRRGGVANEDFGLHLSG